ncbi:uncharacterized protein G2W53_015436 [Senna tora]|uniref:Uncharacterized protein n=1 Tax=Senna tora TaxID=362788 RepID=A0A834WVH1_9FABA|nr:uncharacterized protein G2W53_015436 [Senna tora]
MVFIRKPVTWELKWKPRTGKEIYLVKMIE